MSGSDRLIRDIVHYQQSLNRYAKENNDTKMLHCICKLSNMPIAVSHLEKTGVGRTVNSLRKLENSVGDAAKTLVAKWKNMVAKDDEACEETGPSNNLNEHVEKPNHKERRETESNSSHKDGDRSRKPKVTGDKRTKVEKRKSSSCSNSGSSAEDHDSEASDSENDSQSEDDRHKNARRSNRDDAHSKDRKSRDGDRRSNDRKRRHSSESSDDDHRTKKAAKNEKSNSSAECDRSSSHSRKKSSSSDAKHSRDKKEASKDPKRDVKKHADKSKDEKRHESKDEKRHESKDEKRHESKDEKRHEPKDEKRHEPKDEKRHETRRDKGDSKREKSGEKDKHDRSKSKKHESKEKSKPEKVKKVKDVQICSESGTSFAEALGMLEPTTSKGSVKKSKPSSQVSTPEKVYRERSPAEKERKSHKSEIMIPIPPPPPKVDLDINISSLLPTITPNYRPISSSLIDAQNARTKIMNDDEALTLVMSQKNLRTKVYSGNKCAWGEVPTLFELCTRILQDNIDALEFTGGVPYSILKPVLDKATPDQLFVMEHHNPYLIGDTDELWALHCQKDFRTKKRQELESWREMYLRCLDEREAKLKVLTANIKQSQDKSIPVRQTKLAYIDSEVKPPRNIARKQAKNGIEKKPILTPTARLNAIASSGTSSQVAVPSPAGRSSSSTGGSSAHMKQKKAPLMQKTLAFLKGGRFRR